MVIVNGDETRIFSSYNDLEHQSRAPYPSHRRGHVGNYRSYEFCRCRCLCCCECGLMLVNYTDSNVYAMWNPATGEEKLIPNHQNQRQFEVCGIGFDSKNNEYKPFFAYSLSERMEIEMYSFKTNQWRNLVYPPDSESELGIDFLYGYRWIVYANGIAHWVGYISHDFFDKLIIISFDMGSDKIITTPFPNDVVFSYHVVFNESLALVNYRGPGSCNFDIWVLGEYGNKDSWSMLFTIPTLQPLQDISRIESFWSETTILVLCQEEENDGDEKAKLFLYDTLTQQALDLHIGGINTRVMTCPKTLLPIVSQ
ncbi:F-box/kelch-repeat protein At3g23880 [Ziziphus jujuba]|uniref:F-box/kelch-repeat protein At3g23880 n=1 Tax=Ziziphus jujuba TaxID=326968 RepID=A0A6P3ZRE2_ZIZJJ|nr:F-box/kelch-repeat protein At3g23880 [Ziziphus jujuba]